MPPRDSSDSFKKAHVQSQKILRHSAVLPGSAKSEGRSTDAQNISEEPPFRIPLVTRLAQ